VKGQLKTYHDAIHTERQHKSPCSDCPWSRKALRGWLGNMDADEWIRTAHGDGIIECHTTDKQCAGGAIYRANVCKVPRDDRALRLKSDRIKVFATPMEFTDYHTQEDVLDSPAGGDER
jgi:hypothetical protein